MPERDDFTDLPSLARFGEDLAIAGRQDVPRRGGSWLGRHTAFLSVVIGIATTATATAVTLRNTVISAPDPRVVAAAQSPLAGTEVVPGMRADDPASGPPWALRLSRSQTGLTCTTTGQMRDAVFGIVGIDGRFRSIPTAVVDACGRPPLLGARVVAAPTADAVRSIVYGVAGDDTRKVVLIARGRRRQLPLGSRGAFIAALRGYPEDNATRVLITNASGRTADYPIGANPRLVTDLAGQPAWRLARYALGTRLFCAHLADARSPAGVAQGNAPNGGRASVPTACLDRRGRSDWAAYAERFRPGQHGPPGFDQWSYRGRPARTIVLGAVRRVRDVRSVTVITANTHQQLIPAPNGAFAAVLPSSVDPRQVRFTVRFRDGRVETGRRRHALAPDVVPARRLP